MNNVDKISKEVRLVLDSSKDLLVKNLLESVSKGILTINNEQMETVVSILNMSLDEGYLRAIPSFQNSIKKYL
jgi:hypothetical protein